MRQRKKTCGDPVCRRKGQMLSLDEFPKHRHRPDGRNNYCRECAVRKVREYRARKEAKQQAQKIFHAAIAVHRKAEITDRVEGAIAMGMRTREQIQRSTKLDYDTIGEILCDLVWQVKTVRIERVGNQRQFVRAA